MTEMIDRVAEAIMKERHRDFTRIGLLAPPGDDGSKALPMDVRAAQAAVAAMPESGELLALLKRAQAALVIWNDPDDGAGLPTWADGPWKTEVLDTIKAIDAALEPKPC